MNKKYEALPYKGEWTPEILEEYFYHIDRIAKEEFNFDLYPNQVEIITSNQMIDAYSTHAMPVMYYHWKFGKSFTNTYNAYEKGYQNLAFEVVTNTNPCIAYIMEENSIMMQALVYAHACVSGQTEYLTPFGWKKISDYQESDLVGQYTADGKVEFVKPINYIKRPQQSFIYVKGQKIEQQITDDHRVVFLNGNKNLVEISGKELFDRNENKTRGFSGKFINAANLMTDNKLDMTDDQIRLAIAIKADGSYIKKYETGHFNCVDHHRVRFHLKKTRKIDRLKLILNNLGIDFLEKVNEKSGSVSIYFDIDHKQEKRFTAEWYGASFEQLKLIGEEILLWDGCASSNSYSSKYKEDVDYIQFVWAMTGKQSFIVQGKRAYSVRFSNSSSSAIGNNRGQTEFEIVKSNDNLAYCFTVPSSMFITRFNDKISVTGNCIGHNFVFKNNYMFRDWTDASFIIDYLIFARNYIKKCEEKYGVHQVEDFLDSCHALELYGVDRYKKPNKDTMHLEAMRLKSIEFLEENYDDVIQSTIPKKKDKPLSINEFDKKYNAIQEENLLYFLEKNTPNLETWKKEILRIVRKISQYFYPQRQTSLINEGAACVTGDTLIDTPAGLFTAKEIVDNKLNIKVHGSKSDENICNWFYNKNKKRIKLVTNFGYELHGGFDHKIFVDGEWKELNSFKVGDSIPINVGNNVWPVDYVKIDYNRQESRITSSQICKNFGINQIMLHRFRHEPQKVNPKHYEACQAVNDEILKNSDREVKIYRKPHATIPTELNEKLAYFLGIIIGDGCVGSNDYKNKKGFVNLTSIDDQLLAEFRDLAKELFNLDTKIKKDRNHFNIRFYCHEVVKWLHEDMNICVGKSSHIKTVPDLILKSPQSVVSAFIRGHMDTDGCVTSNGTVILSSTSEKMLKIEQQLLLKMGIVCAVSQKQKDNCYQLRIFGENVKKFKELIGFNLKRKSDKLNKIVEEKSANYQKYRTRVNIIRIEEDEGDTYDFSVMNTHEYKSSIFINHNCFVHYKIIHKMYEQGLVSEGFMLEFYESHCSVVNQVNYDHPYYGQIGINVYSLGFNMFRDIERICMEPTEEDKEYFPHWAGNGDWLGTFKHVVKNYRDESFIRQYLSPKLIRDYKFFSVYDNPASPNMYITAIHNKRGYEDIKESLANMFDLSEKLPDIQVNKVNPKTRKLFLKHISNESKILEPKNTKEVLLHLVNIWKFDVQLDSYDSEGKIYNTFDTEKFDR